MRLATHTTEPRHQDNPDRANLAQLSDADLLDAWSRDQHRQALATLVDRYSVMVLSVCRRRSRSDADAQDAFQTTFLYLARNSRKIRQPERLAGWLHRVAQRAAVATRKSSKRETEPMVEPPDQPADPLDRLSQLHEAIVLDEELADLPEHYRSALVMHIYEGRPLQYLAEHFGTTIGSVRGRLQRGKKMLARRLRHRGVVPILAFTAANTWTVSHASAAQASEAFQAATCQGPLPEPPIETSLLEPLVAQGIRLMPSIYTAAGVTAGAVALLVTLSQIGTSHGQGSGAVEQISMPATVQGQFGGPVTNTVLPDADATPQQQVVANQNPAQAGNNNQVQQFQAAGGGGGLNSSAGLVWTYQPVLPEADTRVAQMARAAIDETISLSISTTLAELPKELQAATGDVPVLIDDRAMAFAKLQPSQQEIKYTGSEVPLRTALRSMLKPLGLKVVVEDEGMVITADPSALVHQGIGTSRWINVEESAEKAIAQALAEPANMEAMDLSIFEAAKFLQKQHNIPVV
ncbi:MAG: sigma-70 family RNA polymerase sigma factor, partial [Pirellulales bacterium]|nr:sigma-70 family RNA polymerase sigma factor [Pirellulales bacterium]